MYDLNAGTETVLGEHKGEIRCVEFTNEVNAVLTGSWDGTVKMWDSRVPNCVGTYNQGNERVSPNLHYALILLLFRVTIFRI